MRISIQILRSDMMTKPGSGFTRRDKKKIEYLTPANEAQRRVVMDVLPLKHFLRSQMEACGTRDDWNKLIYCRVPLCPRCHMRERTVQSAKAIKSIFPETLNDEMAFVTILLPVQLDFRGMTKLFEAEKRRLRTFVDRHRADDTRWNDFHLMGWWEIDRMSWEDYQHAGRNTQIALDDLGFPTAGVAGQTIWRPHLHAIVRRGSLTVEEISKALRKETHSGSYQVDIQPFRTNRDVADNLKNVIRYSLKFRIESNYKRPDAQDFIEAEVADTGAGPRAWWPAADIAAYLNWLCPAQRSGFQSLRVIIGSKAADDEASSAAQTTKDANGPTLARAIIDRVRNRHKGDKLLKAHGISCLEISSDLKSIELENKELVLVDNHDARLGCVYNNTIHDANWTGHMPADAEAVAFAPSSPAPDHESCLGPFSCDKMLSSADDWNVSSRISFKPSNG